MSAPKTLGERQKLCRNILQLSVMCRYHYKSFLFPGQEEKTTKFLLKVWNSNIRDGEHDKVLTYVFSVIHGMQKLLCLLSYNIW